jgi:hypothetical protein
MAHEGGKWVMVRHIKAQQAHVLLGPHHFKAQQAHHPIGVCLLCSECGVPFGLHFNTPSPGHSSCVLIIALR